MKCYGVVVDISPSEQLTDKNEIKVMGMVFSLKKAGSCEEVGKLFPDDRFKFRLRKWSSASSKYKKDFIKHAYILKNSGNIIFGSYISSDEYIRKMGKLYFENAIGEFPEPSSYNIKNRPRIKMGGYEVDGLRVEQYEVLIDDLIVLGWYAEALVGCQKMLVELNKEDVKLNVLIDRLPNEQGDYNKAVILKDLCKRRSGGLLEIIGVPAKSDFTQRDLLVDNIAGLRREIYNNKNSFFRDNLDLFGLFKEKIL